MTQFIRSTFPALLLLGAAFQPVAASAENFSEKAGVKQFALANGLELVVIPDHRSPVVTHMIWYKTGSADELPGKSGIAHFFEHLMFKGTAKHKAGEFSAAVSAIGGEENAFTSYDYTAYYQKVSPAALPSMMAFEADRMRNLVLTDAVIGPERDVILEERRSRVDNSPDSILAEEVNATLYQNHPYGIPVIGWMNEIEKLNRADAVAFYERYYSPGNAIVVVAGDVEPDQVRQMAEESYGLIAAGPVLPPRERPQEPEQNTARTVTLTDPRVSVPQFSTTWLVPSYSEDNGEAEALDMLSEILGGGIRSRLYQALVVKSGLAASAGAYYQSTAIDETGFGVYALPRGAATLAEVEKAVAAEISRLATNGVTEIELAAAKKRFIRSLIFSRDDPSGMAQIFGSTLATGGTIADIDQWQGRIEAVTAIQVQAAAAKWLDAKRSVTAYLLPEKGEGQ